MHVQIIFDLTQIYSKKLEYFMNQEAAKTNNRQEVQMIMDEYSKKLGKEINQYKAETEYGQNMAMQIKWNEKVEAMKKELSIN